MTEYSSTPARYRKAIVGILTPLVGWLCLKIGLDLDADTTAYVVSVATGLVVAAVPNAP